MSKYKIYLLAILCLIFVGCSKESDEEVDNSPVTLVYFTVSDENGSDLLDIKNPQNILHPDFFRERIHPMLPDEYEFSAEFSYGSKGSESLGNPETVKRSTLDVFEGKYALCFSFAPVQSDNENVTISFKWKDGIESNVFDFRLHNGMSGKKQEYVTLNGEQIEKIGYYRFHYNIVK